MVWCMLKSKKMPKEFWAEAVDCAVYLLHWCPSKSLDKKTQQEAWNGMKPTVSHLRIFRSIVYEFIPITEEEETGELEDMKSKKLKQAMDEEIKSIEKNDTWKLMTLRKGQKAIGVKWIYNANKNANGEVEKWKIHQIDVKSAFLKGLLEDVYYVEQPEGYVVKGKEGIVDYGMFYSTREDFKLVGYSHSDWAVNKDDGRSTSRFLFFLGNNAFTWSSKKKPIVTLSSCEAEYVDATSCVCHAI
ncbi:retrovirus-related pol polyprotein from transposon TNT 1-94 [Tanacetum coccineum]